MDGFGAWSVWQTGATSTDQVGDVTGDGAGDLVQAYDGRGYVAESNGATAFHAWDVWA